MKQELAHNQVMSSYSLWFRSLCFYQRDLDCKWKHLCGFAKPDQGSGQFKKMMPVCSWLCSLHVLYWNIAQTTNFFKRNFYPR